MGNKWGTSLLGQADTLKRLLVGKTITAFNNPSGGTLEIKLEGGSYVNIFSDPSCMYECNRIFVGELGPFNQEVLKPFIGKKVTRAVFTDTSPSTGYSSNISYSRRLTLTFGKVGKLSFFWHYMLKDLKEDPTRMVISYGQVPDDEELHSRFFIGLERCV